MKSINVDISSLHNTGLHIYNAITSCIPLTRSIFSRATKLFSGWISGIWKWLTIPLVDCCHHLVMKHATGGTILKLRAGTWSDIQSFKQIARTPRAYHYLLWNTPPGEPYWNFKQEHGQILEFQPGCMYMYYRYQKQVLCFMLCCYLNSSNTGYSSYFHWRWVWSRRTYDIWPCLAVFRCFLNRGD